MTEKNAIFDMEIAGNTLVLIPRSNLSELQFVHFDQAADRVFRELDACAARNVILDLEHTDYYGSTAIGFFVKLWKRVRCADGNMVLCHVSENEQEILRVTRLDLLWRVYANREAALANIEGRDDTDQGDASAPVS